MNPGYIVVAIIIVMMLFIALFGSWRKKENPAAPRPKSRNDIYREAAEILGVRFIKGGVFSSPRILGEMDGMTITAGVKSVGSDGDVVGVYETGVRYAFECDGIFEIVSTGSSLPVGSGFTDREAITCGDDAFDSAMRISYNKSARCVIAMLDGRLRKAILDLAKNEGTLLVSRYGIHIYYWKLHGDPEGMVCELREIMAVAKILLGNGDFRSMHIGNIRNDPVPAVRLKNIRMLLSHYPLDGEISALLDACMKDPDVLMQYEAAKYLKPRGLEHIMGLIREKKITDANMIIEAVDVMGYAAYREASPFLAELFDAYANMDLRRAILLAAKKIGAPSLSPFLMSLLKGRGDDTRDLAIDALSTCGTVDSIEKLMKLSDESMNPFLRSKISETVAAIQDRLGDVEKGWLSAAALGDREGALSKADGAEEGSLSKAEDDKGKSE